MDRSEILCSADELKSLLNQANIHIIDGSWHLPNANRDAKAEFLAEHIPGSVFFDIDEASDHNSGLPHTMPSAQDFGQYASALGISETDSIVVYDTAGLFSAARVWWMFKQFGARDVRLLNGGLPVWKAKGGETTSETTEIVSSTFAATEAHSVVSFQEMRSIVDTEHAQILDARGPGRFSGKEAEPRPGMRSGHMPNAINVPFPSLLNEDGTVKSDADLRAVFQNMQTDSNSKIITSCGSGVTAAIIVLALELIGYSGARLYDGSWSEWGSRADTPIVVD